MAPKSPAAHYRLGTAYAAAKNLDSASASLKKAIELQPGYADALVALTGINVSAGRLDEALKTAEQIKNQAPQSPVGYALEGDVLLRSKKYNLAGKSFDKAYALEANAATAIAVDESNAEGNPRKNTHARIKQWLAGHPDDMRSRILLADAYLSEGHDNLALEQYYAILQKHPDNPAALNNAAEIMRRQKNPMAIKYAERAYELAKESPNTADTLGWILLQQGNSVRALELLKKAVDLAPQRPEIRYHYAAALAKSGDKAEARKHLEQALAGGKQFQGMDDAKALLATL